MSGQDPAPERAEEQFEEHERWDANDPRRQHDQMAPPQEPCESYCLHCGRTFMSDQMWLQRVIGARDGFEGFWMCPTPNCGGAGFTFDIFPTDPHHPANQGWTYLDDDDDDSEWNDEEPPSEADKPYDPAEPEYAGLDEAFEDDDDIDGEEWKYGLEPGERPQSQWSDEARLAWEEEQKKYDLPDTRPREIEWTDRGDDSQRPVSEDDIPF